MHEGVCLGLERACQSCCTAQPAGLLHGTGWRPDPKAHAHGGRKKIGRLLKLHDHVASKPANDGRQLTSNHWADCSCTAAADDG